MSDFTEKVRAMLDAATPGPWFFEHDEDIPGAREPDRLLIGNTRYTVDVFYDHTHHCGWGNYELIAAAPTLLREAIERIEKLENIADRADDMAAEVGEYVQPPVVEEAVQKFYAALSALDAKEQS